MSVTAFIPSDADPDDVQVYEFIPLYLEDATARMNSYLVDGALSFTTNDTYAMQSMLAEYYLRTCVFSLTPPSLVSCTYEFEGLFLSPHGPVSR